MFIGILGNATIFCRERYNMLMYIDILETHFLLSSRALMLYLECKCVDEQITLYMYILVRNVLMDVCKYLI